MSGIRDVRFDPKVAQIDLEWDKSDSSKDPIPVYFGSQSENARNLIWQSRVFVPFEDNLTHFQPILDIPGRCGSRDVRFGSKGGQICPKYNHLLLSSSNAIVIFPGRPTKWPLPSKENFCVLETLFVSTPWTQKATWTQCSLGRCRFLYIGTLIFLYSLCMCKFLWIIVIPFC